jgi:hypothetical protein
MAMWVTNSSDNQDRLRLFVDGSETGTVKYGTGLIYGTGVIYGEESVSGTTRFIVDDINLTDSFARIFVGSDYLKTHGARALMDNIRFSNIERTETLITVGSDVFDTNYSSNTDLVNPVSSDIYTTKLIDFNKSDLEVTDFATLLNAERGVFRWECKVIDSFNRIKGNTYLENLLISLINKLKGAHTEVIISIVE